MFFESMVKRVRQEGQTKEEMIDLFLFFGIFLFSDVLLVPVMGLTEEGEYQINWHDSLPPYLLYPVLVVLILALALLWFRRASVTGLKPSRWLWIFYIVLVLFRTVSLFSFPYAPREFHYSYQYENYTAQYNGFSFYNRFSTFFSELYYLAFLFFLYTYMHTFSPRFLSFLRILFFVLIGVTFAATVYSAVTEGSVIVSQWRVFFESGGEEKPNILAKSFTSNRNVFGFLLMVSVFCCILLMFGEKGNTLLYIPIAYFSFWIIAIFCRTATGLTGLMVVFAMVYYPICFLHTRPLGSRISLIGVLFLVTFFFGLTFYFLGTAEGLKIWLAIRSRYFNSETLEGRYDLNLLGLSMMNDPYVFLFGYNRCPGDLIFEQLKVQMNPLDPAWSCHNGFLQLWIDEGFVPLLACLGAYGVLIYQVGYLVKKDKSYLPMMMMIFLALTFYSFLEPRAMFLKEGMTLILIAVMLLPIRYSYLKEKEKPVIRIKETNGRYWES